MTEENPTYDRILKENEDLLLRNSELELENSILKEEKNAKTEAKDPGFRAFPPPRKDQQSNSPEEREEPGEDDLGERINIEVDFSQGAKIVKIKTEKDKLVYTVSFLANPDGTFLVKVWKFGNLVVPVEIYRVQYEPSMKDEAVRKFKVLILDYSNLVKAETDRPDPRKIFDDCVNYRITDPDCCRNCRFSTKEEFPEKKWIKPRKPRTICTNRSNISQYERILKSYDRKFFRENGLSSCGGCPCGKPEIPDEEICQDGTILPLQTYPNPQPYPPFVPPVEIDMKVVVDPRGICEGYKRGEPSPVQRYEDIGSFEFDKDLMLIISNMVDGKIGQITQEDVVVYCGDSEDTAGRN